MIRAPDTGPLALTTDETTPLALNATVKSIACSSLDTKNATVGPEPETIPPNAP